MKQSASLRIVQNNIRVLSRSCFFVCQKDGAVRPSIIIASVPLPYQIEEDLILKVRYERYIPYLTAEGKDWKAGVDFIVMPCNRSMCL